MPYPCCCENRGECFACKGDIPFVDAKIESMRQAESPVYDKTDWLNLVRDVERSDEIPSDVGGWPPIIIKPYGTNIDADGKFWYPEGPSRWCTTTDENSNPDIRTSQTGGGDVCSGFAGNSDSNGWKRCYRVEAPKEFPTYTWSEYVGYDQPYPHLMYPPSWEDLQVGTSYEAFDLAGLNTPGGSRALIPTRQALCQWVTPWTPICGEDLDFNWNEPGFRGEGPDPLPHETEGSGPPGELYAGRYQVWFYNEMWKMIWEILTGQWVKLIKFDRQVCQELFGEDFLNAWIKEGSWDGLPFPENPAERGLFRDRSMPGVWRETIRQAGELLTNFFLEHGIDLRPRLIGEPSKGRNVDRSGLESDPGALIGVSQGWENWIITHKLIEKLTEWGFDYNVLHGRMDVHQFHCDPNKYKPHKHDPELHWEKVMHLDYLNVGRGPTYDWIYCAAGSKLDSQVGQKEYWRMRQPGVHGAFQAGVLLDQPIKLNNPFWRLAPANVEFTMAWAERHYWTSNGPYKPYGDHGYIPTTNAGGLQQPMHWNIPWVNRNFTVERMLHEWTYSDSRQYPFNCTLGGLSGDSGVTFDPNPQPDGGYGTFKNPRLNCGTHDEDTTEHEARQPHRIPYAGSNDTMNIDTNRHDNFDAEWHDIKLEDVLSFYRERWDAWPETREEAEQNLANYCRNLPPGAFGDHPPIVCRSGVPGHWEARERALVRNKEETPFDEWDDVIGAREKYRLGRVLPPSGERQEDKCKVEEGSGGSFLVHVPDFDPQTEETTVPLGPSDDRPE